MPDLKISALPAATTPLAGTEIIPLVQGGTTDRTTVADLTAGRAVSVLSLSATGGAIGATGSISSSAGFIRVTSDSLGFTLGASNDVQIYRDAANILALRNGVNAQTFRVYNTYTDASNYERIGMIWDTNVAYVGSQNLGTGTARVTALRSADELRFIVGANLTNAGTTAWRINTSAHLLANADNAYDIGASGANRPRAIYVAGTGTFGGAVSVTGNVSALGGSIIVGTNGALRFGSASEFGLISAPANGVFRPQTQAGGQLTVATLPAAATAGAGARAFVTDANATTFASIVAGGGANGVPVYSDGTNWRIG